MSSGMAGRSLVAQADESSGCATTAAKVEQVLSLLGGLSGLVAPGSKVLLKPNFVAPFPQAATNLDILQAVVEAVRAAGGLPVVAESAGFEFDTERTFKLLGLREWAKAHDVRLLNLDNEPYVRITSGAESYGMLEVSRCVLEADLLINLPKLKRHSVTRVTLGLKNLMGFLSRDSRRYLHVRGLERGIVALARLVRPQLTILDALTATTRAVYGETRALGAVAGSRDMVALDHYGCRLLGEDPEGVEHIREAWRQGLGQVEYQVVGGEPLLVSTDLARGKKSALYRLLFRLMFTIDLGYTSLRPHRSLIPAVHYWLGIRPHIEAQLCDRCGACAAACPMAAIDVLRKRIVANACMRLRCLRCVDACPRHAIVLHGWRRPAFG